ncbi:MAG: 3,4-dihydroxy-2-butanone-4-phosphate synthase [Leucobacter sp.]
MTQTDTAASAAGPANGSAESAPASAPGSTPGISTIEEAVAAIREGRPVIVADDEDRENEGDVILSAELATPEWVAWTVRWSSGLLCAPMSNDIADQLDLPMMVARNEDVRSTAYTVTVDATHGVTTGISASDRTTTLRALANPEAAPTDVRRPGHVLPLRAVDGGVRARDGHTEASVELMRLAGLRPVAVIAEIVADDGEMMRLPGLIELGARENVPVITIEQLIAYLDEKDPEGAPSEGAQNRRVSLRAETLLPTEHGEFRALAYRDRRAGIDHIALIADTPEDAHTGQATLVRVHSECVTGEAFGSLKCECGPQLDAALDLIHERGGALVYLRGHEGRGIGLANKLRAYQLQEAGVDTLDANLQLGLPADDRDYTAAAEILADLGITQVRLLTNNPDKVAQLEAHGVEVVERVPLFVGVTEQNIGYLTTKRDRMGHQLPADVNAGTGIAD